MKERHIFYLHADQEDKLLPLSDIGLDVRNYLCGLFSIHGFITFDKSVTSDILARTRCFLCSDFCQLSSLPHFIQLPILREIILTDVTQNSSGNLTATIEHDYSQVLWLDVTSSSEVRNIRIYLRNELGQRLPVKACHLKSTLLAFPKDGAYSS